MVAIGGDDVVIAAEHGQRPSADRFLADVQMAEAADLSERVRLGTSLLEATLEQHRTEERLVQFGVGDLLFALLSSQRETRVEG